MMCSHGAHSYEVVFNQLALTNEHTANLDWGRTLAAGAVLVGFWGCEQIQRISHV